ncbi:CDC48 family AAA ATPase [Rhodoferax antarcticus]|uniref:CDC48 family AAA ATPase n=1 Tax=Rhodoferax antarcticus TaxID=81479 RepID=UPI0022259151|nr:CDC48 family AAA ATPase [Rhodoferax antarcticus]MCW2313323.1 transitional endoplasmic reticulum ATPase [Rhodoferax antarcticus]
MQKKTPETKKPAAGALRLKVCEALGKDAGRALARMDPADIEALGAKIGDIIEVSGKRSTACRLMPAYKESRNGAKVQLDGLSRGNAGVALDEIVTLRKVATQLAQKLTLSPTDVVPGERDMKYIGSLLDGLPVIQGDRIRATLFGSRHTEFIVRETTPKGPVLIAPTTLLTVDKAPAGKEAGKTARPSVSYEDIGGLGPVVQKIREMIELPLRHPQIFEKLGIQAPKGVLLHGSPGTGKTLVARAVANETDAYFISISGPEIIGKFYGESEAKLRSVFEEAEKHAPSIIFIDEIEAIAPKREELGGEKQVERRVVAQLLTLMDGLKSRGKVIVIAATNLPNLLDPALRRPGRFDREITLPVPDRHGRLQILEIHSRGMPLATNVDMGEVARITHGFVGADLEALCREAAMTCLRRVLPEVDMAQSTLPYETLMQLEISKDDFLSALREVEPSALREVFVEVPTTTWDDVGGLEEVKTLLQEAIEWPQKYRALLEAADVKPPKGILLVGPPGCGKTLLAQAAASMSEMNFISIKGPALLSKYVGESESAVREVFRKAKQAAPCLVFFDEIDALVPQRSGGSSEHVSERVVGQFLTELDGVEKLTGVLILAATNRPDMIDPALLRPGRFDMKVVIPAPNAVERLAILKVHTKKKHLAKGFSIDTLISRTEGLSGADLAAICQNAALNAVRERVHRGQKMEAAVLLQARHFEAALKSIHR